MQNRIDQIRREALAAIAAAHDAAALDAARVSALGKKGALTELLRGMGALSPEERPRVGQLVNECKAELERAIEAANERLVRETREQAARTERVDISLPGRRPARGSLHPLTETLEEIVRIFERLGFVWEDGPEVELAKFNFDELNFPPDHPARDMQDTIFVDAGDRIQKTEDRIQNTEDRIQNTEDRTPEGNGSGNPQSDSQILLRTHTSPVQVRVMHRHKPPVRILAPGWVYRADAIDASHYPMFSQVEGLLVDKQVSLGDLKGVLIHFVHEFYGRDTKIRFRPSFFPFTEPSAELDISCFVCHGAGRVEAKVCPMCKGTGWKELLGCGMVDPAVYANVGYDPESVSGWAFGMGIERIAMFRHGVDDIRLFFEGDLRFLRQF
jgi:phenylalanyl-tRNA synthetase alpha chain